MFNVTKNVTKNTSFATMVQREALLGRDQAIVFDSVEGHTIEEYAIELAKLVKPLDICYVSRIAHARICFYLSSKVLADQLIDNGAQIKIGDKQLEVRPLVSRAKRVIISNVEPFIASSTIIEELQKFDVTPVSPISTIKASMNVPELAHLLSFRKQMYVKPEDVPKIPNSIQITIDTISHWIYFSGEKLICYHCKEEGHLSRFCKEKDKDPASNLVLNTPQQEAEKIEHSDPQNNSSSSTQENIAPAIVQTGVKRPLPSSGSSNVSSIDVLTKDEDELPFQVVKKKTNKKAKNNTGSTPKTMGQQLEPAKEFINMNESTLPMSYNKVLEFLESTQGKSRSEITQLARISCDDFGSLDDMLTDIYKHVSSRTLRSRLTRIKKCLCPSDNKTEDKHSDAESLAEGMTTDDQLDDEDFNPTASRNGSTTQEY